MIDYRDPLAAQIVYGPLLLLVYRLTVHVDGAGNVTGSAAPLRGDT